MQISNLNFFNIDKNKKKNNQPSVKNQGLQSDVFEKTSNVSFKGQLSAFESILKNEVLADVSYDQTLSELFMYILKKDDDFDYPGFHITSIAEFNNQVEKITNSNPDSMKYSFAEKLNKQLEKLKVVSVYDFNAFIRAHYTKETINQLNGELQDSLDVMTLLKDSTNFKHFPSLILNIYYLEKEKENPNYEKLNEYPEFLKKIGINSDKELKNKLNYLQSDDETLDTTQDIINEIDDLINVYDTKISILSELLNNGNFEISNMEKISKNSMDVIDYLYKKDPQNFETELNNIINYVAEGTIDDIKNSKKNKSSQANKKSKNNSQLKILQNNKGIENEKKYILSFNNLETPKDKIDFYKSLKSSQIESLAEFKNLLKPVYIFDLQPNNIIQNKTSIISSLKGILKDDQSSIEFYNNFKDSINTICSSSEDLDKLVNLHELTKQFNIKNDEEFLKFYNSANKTSLQTIKSDDLRNFVNLLEYNTYEDIVTTAKKTNTSVVKLLQQEKTNFEKIEKDIDELTQNDQNKYFLGKSTLEIYKSHKSPKDDAKIVLKKIKEEISKNDKYNETLRKFSSYFPSEEMAIKFITNNEIKLNIDESNSKEEIETKYQKNCLYILDLLSQDKGNKNYQKRIDFYTNSGFLKNSKMNLTEFLEKFPDVENKKEIINIIADKEIESINSLENEFLTPFKLDEHSFEKLIKNLKSLPKDIDFKSYMIMLDNIIEMFNKYNIPLKINADNIHYLDEKILKMSKSPKIYPSSCMSAINKMLNAKEGYNFFYSLPLAKTNITNDYSASSIASQIINTHEKDNTAYLNILKRLDVPPNLLDEELSEKGPIAAKYILKTALENNPEFISFINSNDWLDFEGNSNEVPNLSFHARLRFIDRFALADNPKINLNSPKVVDSLKDILKRIYTQNPTDFGIKKENSSCMTLFYEQIGKPKIKVVIADDGQIVTIIDPSYTKGQEIVITNSNNNSIFTLGDLFKQTLGNN